MSNSEYARMLYLHALTPIHSGTGQAVAVIDLPVSREKTTGWPVIPASSLKGVLKDALDSEANRAWIDSAFGTTDDAGALCFGDQRILCLAVRSFFGTFAWVTSPMVLARYRRDHQAAGLQSSFSVAPQPAGETQIFLTPETTLARNGKVYLEDLDLVVQTDPAPEKIAEGLGSILFPDTDEAKIFVERLAIVPDTVFDFLSETATEVSAHVRLQDEQKTVAPHGLWYEEAVPAESIFYGPVTVAAHRRRDAGSYLDKVGKSPIYLQIGGKASVGKGLCRLVVAS